MRGVAPRGGTSHQLAGSHAVSATRADAFLRIADLSVRYRGGAIGIRAFTSDLAKGESVGIVGNNGAGKTSLLRAIAGFLPSERVSVQGAVSLDGHSLPMDNPTHPSRDPLVLVPDADKLFSRMSVLDHVKLALRSPRVPEGWAELFPELERLSHRRAGFLSGGERQMLALTAAVLRNPAVLLIDEVGLGLSLAARRRVIAGINTLRSKMGPTLLMVEQGEEMLEEVVDRFIILDHGEISEERPSGAPTRMTEVP